MDALDPRSVANTILSLAEDYEFSISQLSLQKILYFVHGKYLTETGKPLLSGSFEAWRYGPVHPTIYSAFKSFGSNPIIGRATIRNLNSKIDVVVTEPSDPKLRLFIRQTASAYLSMPPGRLVDLSHAPNSPWDVATLASGTDRRFGSRITNDQIFSRFRFHKISVSENPRSGEPNEESPPS